MSTDFSLSEKVHISDLLDGRLDRFGIHEKVTYPTSDQQKCLTDGADFVWVYANDEGYVSCLTRYGANDPNKILGAIADAFRTDIYSEHQPQFWGFDTQEEWDAWQHAAGKERLDKFYSDILKFVAGEPNGIPPGHPSYECKALIAKRLVAEDPGLVSPERRTEFMEAIWSTYHRDHDEPPF